jgi:hypothetical protein
LPPRSEGKGASLPWLPLKDLYRSLARAAHPDFAKSDADRARRSELMARVNAAYHRQDRVLLELLHEEAGAEERVDEPSLEKRASHAERRVATIAPMVTSLERGLLRLRASATWKELETAQNHGQKGGDYFADTLRLLRRETSETTETAFDGIVELESFVQGLRGREKGGTRSSPGTLLRRAVGRVGKARLDAEGKKLAVDLRRAAEREPWQVVLSLFALFGEASAEPPPGLRTLTAARERYELLVAPMRGAPPFDRAVVKLPPFLELGLRAYPRRLAFGIQVKRGELRAAIESALGFEEVVPVARRVLAVMGRRERCEGCGRQVYLAHLFRTRGLHDVHGLGCPECAAVSSSYRTFGAPEGLEALSPYAQKLGLVFEQPVRLGSTVIVLGFLSREQRRLDAKTIAERFATLHLDDARKPLTKFVRLHASRKLLARSAPVRQGTTLRLTLAEGAPMSVKELERQLQVDARSRFRKA